MNEITLLLLGELITSVAFVARICPDNTFLNLLPRLCCSLCLHSFQFSMVSTPHVSLVVLSRVCQTVVKLDIILSLEFVV